MICSQNYGKADTVNASEMLYAIVFMHQQKRSTEEHGQKPSLYPAKRIHLCVKLVLVSCVPNVKIINHEATMASPVKKKTACPTRPLNAHSSISRNLTPSSITTPNLPITTSHTPKPAAHQSAKERKKERKKEKKIETVGACVRQ